MKKIFKGLGLGLMALSLVVVGANQASATSTYAVNAITETGALTITSAGALGLVAGANAINIGADATAKTITIGSNTTTAALALNAGTGDVTITSGDNISINGSANGDVINMGTATGVGSVINIGTSDTANTINIGTGAAGNLITVGNDAQTAATIIYGGSTTNAVRILPVVGAVATEAHGLDVVSAGEMGSGDSLVGINSVLTPTGSSGTWASAVYGKVVQSTSQRLSGYMSGGEFEVANSVAGASNEMFPLVLDSNNSAAYHPSSAYIWAQDFGSATPTMPNLLQLTGVSAGDATTIFSDDAGDNLVPTHTLKIQIGGADYWILLSNVAPN